MIEIRCEQLSPEWVQARLGIPTASKFHCLLKPADMKPSAGAAKYARELIAEVVAGEPQETYSNGIMARGTDMQVKAVQYYQALHDDATLTEVGFIMNDERSAGCSPDQLVNANGGLEIKCLELPNHIANLLCRDRKYTLQCQGGMWITGRKWWDLMFYNPATVPAIYRIDRDEACCEALTVAVGNLQDVLLEHRATLWDDHGIDTTPVKVRAQTSLGGTALFPGESYVPLTEEQEAAAIAEAKAALPVGDEIPF